MIILTRLLCENWLKLKNIGKQDMGQERDGTNRPFGTNGTGQEKSTFRASLRELKIGSKKWYSIVGGKLDKKQKSI